MTWTLHQSIVNGVCVARGKEVKYKNVTVYFSNTVHSSPSGYSEDFYGLKCEIFSEDNELLFQLFNATAQPLWKGMRIEGVSWQSKANKPILVFQRFWAVIEKKNSEEKD